MPDHNYPKARHHNSPYLASQNLVGFEQRPNFSSLLEPAQNVWEQPLQGIHRSRQAEGNSRLKPLTFHAEPLAPLRQRDRRALDDLFGNVQTEETVADVCLRLKQLCPEPCWEDSLFEFLHGYV